MLRSSAAFSIRRGEVNAEMYVHRPDLESALVRAIHSGQHIAITGESGCGKSWLYKIVFQENNVFYKTVNLALATDDGDISSAIVRTVLEGNAVLKETEKRSGMAAMLQIFGLIRETARRDGQTIWYAISSGPARGVVETVYAAFCPQKPTRRVPVRVKSGSRRAS